MNKNKIDSIDENIETADNIDSIDENIETADNIDSIDENIEQIETESVADKTIEQIHDAVETIIHNADHHQKLMAHRIGDRCLTAMTVILCAISLFVDAHFAPFIILLMSSRIGKSIYMISKTKSKKEIGKLVLWVALFSKSVLSCYQIWAGVI